MSGYTVGSGGRGDGVELLLILVQCINSLTFTLRPRTALDEESLTTPLQLLCFISEFHTLLICNVVTINDFMVSY